MTRRPTGPRHEKPPSLRKLRPGHPHTLESAHMTPEYTKLLESIWSLLSYGKEPCWVYAASRSIYHIEQAGNVIVLADRWDRAMRDAVNMNLNAMKVCEHESDQAHRSPRVSPLVDCAVAWHITGYYTLAPWVRQARFTNIFDRETTALEYVVAVLPLLAEWPEQTTEMAQRLASHYNARIFS